MSSFLPFLESFIAPPTNCEDIIQAAWKVSEEQVLIPSTSREPPSNFQKKFDSNFDENTENEIRENKLQKERKMLIKENQQNILFKKMKSAIGLKIKEE